MVLIASMYLIDVDSTQAVPGSGSNNHTEVHHRLPVKFGRKLGQ